MTRSTAAAVALCSLFIAACGPNTVQQAAKKGDMKIEGRGEGSVENVTVTITSVTGGTFTIPTGTVFRGGPGTQRMMVARGVEVQLAAGVTQTVRVETYCINRWLDVPGEQADMALEYEPPDPNDPLVKLAKCLEAKSIQHRERQVAMWVVSDNLWNLSRTELIGRLQDEMTKKVDSLDDQGLIRLVRDRLSAAEAEQLAEIIRAQGGSAVRQALKEAAGEIAAKEVPSYIAAEGLLKDCGMDVDGKPLFKG
jgi:hypothetical protein